MNVTPDHNDQRLLGTLAFLDTGPTRARVEVYEGTAPADPEDPPSGSTLLGTLYLDKPAGALSAHALVLAASQVGVCVATGTPQWARLINGAGTPGGDLTASGTGGGGEVEVETALDGKLYLGGAFALTGGSFT